MENRPAPRTATFRHRDDLVAWLEGALDAVAIRGLGLICTPAYPGYTLCFIDIDESLVHLARERVGGQIFGYSALALHIPITNDFSCLRLDKGTPALCQQCNCFPQWRLANRPGEPCARVNTPPSSLAHSGS